MAKPALGVDLSSTKIDLNDPEKVEAAMQDLLQSDPVITSLLDSVTGDSQNILDASIVDAKGLALLHTNPSFAKYDCVAAGGLRQPSQWRYSPAVQADLWSGKTWRLPFAIDQLHDRQTFRRGALGVNTTLLKNNLKPEINKALAFSASAIVLS